jgi:hypothetical protein
MCISLGLQSNIHQQYLSTSLLDFKKFTAIRIWSIFWAFSNTTFLILYLFFLKVQFQTQYGGNLRKANNTHFHYISPAYGSWADCRTKGKLLLSWVPCEASIWLETRQICYNSAKISTLFTSNIIQGNRNIHEMIRKLLTTTKRAKALPLVGRIKIL